MIIKIEFYHLLGILFIALKLTNQLDWHWITVLSLIWANALVGLIYTIHLLNKLNKLKSKQHEGEIK